MTTNNVLFGRKWKFTVNDSEGGNSWTISSSDIAKGDPSSDTLRATFRVEKLGYQAYWFADIEVWNLNKPTEQALILQGTDVKLEAGYENGNFGIIFEGQVFQPLFDRENVTDYKTTLHCLDSFGILDSNINNLTIASGYDYRGLVAGMARNAREPFEVGHVSEGVEKKTFPRGRTVFGDPRNTFREVSRDSAGQHHMRGGKLNITRIEDESQDEALVISPQNGLIGTPQMAQNGIKLKCLLNAKVDVMVPCQLIKLDQSLIRQNKLAPGQLPTMLDKDGLYKVAKVIHYGDTRGNDWYTEITAVSRLYPIFGGDPNAH